MTDDNDYYCRNCAADLTDPTNCGFLFQGDWYCHPLCAETAAGFWSRGYELREGHSKNGAVIDSETEEVIES